MPSCIVKGCKHHTSMKSSNPLLTMHVFPRELSRIKLWLQQTGQNFDDIDAFAAQILDAAKTGKYRICSAHFDPDCYTTVGCRLVLKHDAVPTVFPGVYPKPSPDGKTFSPHARTAHMGLDVIGAYAPGFENVGTSKLGFLRKDAATQTKADNDKTRPISLNTSLMERCNKQEEIFDTSGRLIGVFTPDSHQRDLKVRPGLWTYDWSTQIPEEPSRKHQTTENKEALSSLEDVLFSLLNHMAEVPHTRPQKQRTSRLLNRTAEIISILTGEEWTVVKKNAHISKFYQMIREVPIKCGDVAMFFTMEEWDYIEQHEDLYKPVMLETPKDGKDTASHTVAGNSEEKIPPSQQQPIANADHNTDCKVLRNVPAKQSITPKRPKPRQSSLADSIEYTKPDSTTSTAKQSRRKSLKKEEEEADASCAQNSTGDAHQTRHTKDEKFIKKEENLDTCIAESSTAEVRHRWGTGNESYQSESSELWIAQDGTTSCYFRPEKDPRPPVWTHKTYSSKSLPIQCPLSSEGPPDMKPNGSGSKRAATGNQHRCDQCNEHFPDRGQLTAHKRIHTKKPRR
ncbi:uncharacterized protein LOC120918985 isoform X3 [Rana temporaria]|uniref:uncharacterized protein LOC120918985 isoform X3 n=1 Tax=Rana temporaria TaxID=8407 RepID=UPI001AAD08D0|nr:uncharacterized protein LOC120918985 isoform X3 [Rana temporaria]